MAWCFVFFGPSGCGKTHLGKWMAKAWNLPFFDADDFHPPENLQKMQQGIPLTDGDRAPWLKAINEHLRQQGAQGQHSIIACSALKNTYKQKLSQGLSTQWIYLNAPPTLLTERLQNRRDHFFPLSLLQSQIDLLELPEHFLEINAALSPHEIQQHLESTLGDFLQKNCNLPLVHNTKKP